MTPENVAPKLTELKLRLVKWTGDVEGEPEPIGHPQCEEVIEVDLQTGERRILYRRD